MVKRLEHRQYDPWRDHREDNRSGPWPSTAMCIFLQSDEQGGGNYMMGIVQTSVEVTRDRLLSPLIHNWDSYSPWT